MFRYGFRVSVLVRWVLGKKIKLANFIFWHVSKLLKTCNFWVRLGGSSFNSTLLKPLLIVLVVECLEPGTSLSRCMPSQHSLNSLETEEMRFVCACMVLLPFFNNRLRDEF